VSDDAGNTLRLRRVTLLLDEPTQDGEREVVLLTNLPKRDADARAVAQLDRKR